MNLNNYSIKARLYGLSAILIGALLFTAVYAISSMATIGQELKTIAEEDIPLTRVLTEITTHQLEQAIRFERAIRFAQSMGHDNGATAAFNEARQSFRDIGAEVDKHVVEGIALAEEAITLAHNEHDREEFEKILKGLNKIEAEHHDFSSHVEEAFSLMAGGELQQAGRMIGEIGQEEEHLNHELEALLLEIERFTDEAANSAEQHEQSAERLLLVISAVIIATALLIAGVTVSGISRGIDSVITTLTRISNKDFSQEIKVGDRKDEVGAMLACGQTMQQALRDALTTIQNSTVELSTVSEQMARASEESSRNAEEQSTQVDMLVSAMNEMAETVNEVARNATTTAEYAGSANIKVREGEQVVGETVGAINTLATDVEETAAAIEKLAGESEAITTVLDVIKGIAEQTNLLALNAAIEAARAGEQGRGFAVVADEVRTLASRTQSSTSEIEAMIERLHTGTRNAVEAMEKGRSQAAASVSKANEAGTILGAVTAAISGISEMNDQIATSSEEQSSVAEEMNMNLTAIADAGRVNAETSTETAASSQELAALALNLETLAGEFTL